MQGKISEGGFVKKKELKDGQKSPQKRRRHPLSKNRLEKISLPPMIGDRFFMERP